MRLIPKNWSEFQHYKDRRPPWIKLHRSLLDDRDFMTLPVASKAIAPLLWLLASEDESGEFDAELGELSFRLRMQESEINDGLKPLIDKGFFLDASTMLAPCFQVAVPETERETERETEKRREPKSKKKIEKPDSVTEQTWNDFLTHRKTKKANVTLTVLKNFEKEAKKAGWPLENALIETVSRGWSGFKADWVNKGSKTPSQADYLQSLLDEPTEIILPKEDYGQGQD